VALIRALLVAALAILGFGCAKRVPPPRPVKFALSPAVRLGSVMWPNGKSIIYCTQRLDDFAHPIGVAGPCRRLEAGETTATKVLSWATLGRFERSPPNATPASLGGRCKLEIVQGQRIPALRSTTVTWVTPTRREVLDDWLPTDESASVEADAFTSEVTFAPEGEWLAILHVAIGLGDGERIIEVASGKMMKVPACE
jgi:hypothetical protein